MNELTENYWWWIDLFSIIAVIINLVSFMPFILLIVGNRKFTQKRIKWPIIIIAIPVNMFMLYVYFIH